MNSNRSLRVYMAGSQRNLPGGISAVLDSWDASGIFGQFAVKYLVSFRGKGLWLQLGTMTMAMVVLAWGLVRRDVGLLHLHSASRGSFWRKSALAAMAMVFRVPVVMHLHSGEFAHFCNAECRTWQRNMIRAVLTRCAAVIVLAPVWREEIGRIAPMSRVVVVPNPVSNLSSSEGVRAVATRLLFLGRLRESKGVNDLLNSLVLLKLRTPSVEATLAGDGDVDFWRGRAAELGISNMVLFPGWVAGEAKQHLLSTADLLVLPSHAEGLPVCVLEAMAAGVPVIGSRVGGIPFALAGGDAGILVPPGAPHELAAAIRRVLDDGDLRASLSRAGLKHVHESFRLDVVCGQIAELWRGILGGKGPAVFTSMAKDGEHAA